MSEEVAQAAADMARLAARNIEQARRIVTAASQLAWSLYASGDLSVDQHDPISLALGVAEAGIKDVETLMDRVSTLESQLGQAHQEIERLEAENEQLRYALDGTTALLEDRYNWRNRQTRWMKNVIAANRAIVPKKASG